MLTLADSFPRRLSAIKSKAAEAPPSEELAEIVRTADAIRACLHDVVSKNGATCLDELRCDEVRADKIAEHIELLEARLTTYITHLPFAEKRAEEPEEKKEDPVVISNAQAA